MKKILKATAPGIIPGPVTGMIKTIHLPHPETPNKQRVTLTDGESELDCNIHGVHLHIPHDKVGDVVKMDWQNAQAAYLTVFPDGGRCLTLRDGVTYEYRAPKAGTVPSSEDRVVSMAKHYAFCFQTARTHLKKVCPEITIEAVQPVATTLFLDTKHMIKVKPGEADNEPLWEKPEPKGEAPKPEPQPLPKSEPEPGKPEDSPSPSEPSPKEEVPPQLTDKDHDALLKLTYPTFVEKAAKALSYTGHDALRVAWRSLFVKVADSYHQAGKHAKVWFDIFDEIWQTGTEQKQKAMDDMVATQLQKDPATNDNALHRAVAIMSGTL